MYLIKNAHVDTVPLLYCQLIIVLKKLKKTTQASPFYCLWTNLDVANMTSTQYFDSKTVISFNDSKYNVYVSFNSFPLGSTYTSPTMPPSLGLVKPIWERCRLGCLLKRPTTVPSPSHHLSVPPQSAAGLPTGQFRWSAASCHHGHPPRLPLKDNRTVLVTSGSGLC